jgi:4-hydroxy-tetrahydrodipicolinate synthase
MFHGLGTAIITPFVKGDIDLKSFKSLLEYQIANGTKNIFVCGTTGEASTLTNNEQKELIKTTVDVCHGKINVIAGASSSGTASSIELAQMSKELGVDGVLIAVPPYNKPMQNGIYQHYKAIAENVKIPIVLYNVPGRTSRDMDNDTIAKLSKLDYIVALKDASGDLTRVADLRARVSKDFTLLSGEDATAVGFNAMGGKGIVSVSSNVAPKLCYELQNCTKSGDYENALKIQDKLIKLNRVMFMESNPIPIKYACSLLGYGDGSLRLPLTIAEGETREKIADVMRELKLIV